jgi:broad specificity phosphatase PhoE
VAQHGRFDPLYRPPNGESFEDIAVRLRSFLDDLHRDHAGERVVVVAHDAVVLMMRAVAPLHYGIGGHPERDRTRLRSPRPAG